MTQSTSNKPTANIADDLRSPASRIESAGDWRWIDKLRDIADRMEDRTEIGSAYIRKTIDDELLHIVTDGEHRTGPIHKAHTEARRLGNLGLADSCEHILKLLGRIMGAAGHGATQTKSGQGPRDLAKALRGETDRLALAVGYTAGGESANAPTPTADDSSNWITVPEAANLLVNAEIIDGGISKTKARSRILSAMRPRKSNKRPPIRSTGKDGDHRVSLVDVLEYINMTRKRELSKGK